MKNQNGFTLIELVIVIVLLGTLAAVALPKFVNLNTDARIASVRALAGAVDSASDMVHAHVLVTGSTTSVAVEGGVVYLANGYPAATANGIAAALKSTDNYSITAGTNKYTWEHNGATTPASCSVAYVASTAAGSPPTVSSTTIGC